MKIIIPFLLVFILFACTESSIDLNVSVSLNQTDLIISNGDDFDYINARILLNDKYLSLYNEIPAGEEIRIPFVSLTDDEGTQFDIVKLKPLSLTMGATLAGGKHVFVYQIW